MGALSLSKWIDKGIGNKRVWVLDIQELDEDSIIATDFKITEEPKAWE